MHDYRAGIAALTLYDELKTTENGELHSCPDSWVLECLCFSVDPLHLATGHIGKCGHRDTSAMMARAHFQNTVWQVLGLHFGPKIAQDNLKCCAVL